MPFSWARPEEKSCPVASVVGLMVTVTFFWECTHAPLVRIRANPAFHDLIQRDKSSWTWCFHLHG